MKSKFKLGIIVFLIGYIVIFSARMVYVFNEPNYYTLNYSGGYRSAEFFVDSKIKNNIASSKVEIVTYDSDKVVTVDQKYEKVANISSSTKKFENDDKNLRKIINDANAVIQFENNRGIAGNRILELSIGVHQEKFDSFVEEIKLIGKTTDFSINKIDKTSEYKNLNARKAALEKMRDSLISLKSNGGSIQELINLENRIFELEQDLQNYGVQLGDYNAENELCTVKVDLRENGANDSNNITALKNTLNSLLWSAGCYLLIILSIILTLVCLYILLVVIQKGKQVYTDLFKTHNM